MKKLIPESIGILAGKRYIPQAPVLQTKAYPPGTAPKGSPIRSDCATVEIVTPYGSRWYGFERAWIGPDLRMHVELLAGQERDEAVARWETPQ